LSVILFQTFFFILSQEKYTEENTYYFYAPTFGVNKKKEKEANYVK